MQHSTANPHNKRQSKYAPIKARQRRQADGVGSRQHVVKHIYSLLCSQNEKSKYARPTKIFGGGVMREGFACTLLFLSVLSISSIHVASGLFLGTIEPLAFGNYCSLHRTPLTFCAFQSFAFVQLVVSERSGRLPPPAEQSALYIYIYHCLNRPIVQLPCLSFRRSCFFVVAVVVTIVVVINDLTKRRASPRINCDQHPLAKRPTCATRVSVED